MSRADAKDVAVVIPARNEEDRIAACLTALASQETTRVRVVLVVNNTTDRTGDVARGVAAQQGLDLSVLTPTLAPHEGVGTARRIGCDHALRTMPRLRSLLTTDADCITGPHWIARSLAHLRAVDAVCGKVGLIAGEAGVLGAMDMRLATFEGIYRELVQEIYARHAPGGADVGGTHGEAAGASLGFRKSAYLAVGGFASIQCGEDRRIVRALRQAGYRVRHAADVTVQASCRLTGRAEGGMSDALKARIGGADYHIDDSLAPAEWLLRKVQTKTLGPWPPQVPAALRLNVSDLPHHIEMLRDYVTAQTRVCDPAALVTMDSAPDLVVLG